MLDGIRVHKNSVTQTVLTIGVTYTKILFSGVSSGNPSYLGADSMVRPPAGPVLISGQVWAQSGFDPTIGMGQPNFTAKIIKNGTYDSNNRLSTVSFGQQVQAGFGSFPTLPGTCCAPIPFVYDICNDGDAYTLNIYADIHGNPPMVIDGHPMHVWFNFSW